VFKGVLAVNCTFARGYAPRLLQADFSSEFSARTVPGTCPKARGTSRVDDFSRPGPQKKNRSLRSQQYIAVIRVHTRIEKGILAHRQTGSPP
jgi:hypothetical protein